MKNEMTETTAPNTRDQELAMMTAQATTQGMMQLLAPMLTGMQQMTQMMAQTVQQMCAMQESMASMHKAIEHSMPLTGTQARMLNAEIKERAAGIRDKYALDDQARLECTREIRKKLCRRWAVSSIKEIPRSEYDLAMETVERFDESAIALKYI